MKSDYFKNIPEWKNGAPEFTILADEFSGRIPVTRIENWKTIAEALDDSFFNHKTDVPNTRLTDTLDSIESVAVSQ